MLLGAAAERRNAVHEEVHPLRVGLVQSVPDLQLREMVSKAIKIRITKFDRELQTMSVALKNKKKWPTQKIKAKI